MLTTTVPTRTAIGVLAAGLLTGVLLVSAARAHKHSADTPMQPTISDGATPASRDALVDAGSTVPSSPPPRDPFEQLPELTFYDRNASRSMHCRLYLAEGLLDELAAQDLDAFLADVRDPKQPKVGRIDRRLLQLLFRTAYHFDATRVEVTSAYRAQGRKRRREGLHALGQAIDFALSGVKSEDLASYLRKQPRVGVGIYTHRRTRFVHLDVRAQSYHWLDGSPPGRTWRGLSIGDRSLPARDATYKRSDDWPEGFPAPGGT